MYKKKTQKEVLRDFSEKFVKSIILQMEKIDDNWKKPWITIKRKDYFPRNMKGMCYKGMNVFPLLLFSSINDFITPYFITKKFAQRNGLKIVNDIPYPVFHYCQAAQAKSRHYPPISYNEYLNLSNSEKQNYRTYTSIRYYMVYNLDCTDFKEKYKSIWEELLDKHTEIPEFHAIDYKNEILDRVIEEQSWCCRIIEKLSNKAFYSSSDFINMPLRSQFTDSIRFYTTLLHEMAHSTGNKVRLNRPFFQSDEDEDYAKEELVAELSSAILGYFLGITTSIQDDNIQYLKHWISKTKENPDYLHVILGYVMQVVEMVTEKISITPFHDNPLELEDEEIEIQKL